MNVFFMILGCLAIIVGLFVIVQILRAKTYDGDAETLESKDGFPILPRDKRPIKITNPTDDEPESSQMTNIDFEAKSGRQLAEESKADALSSLAMVASQNPSEHKSYDAEASTNVATTTEIDLTATDDHEPMYVPEVAPTEIQVDTDDTVHVEQAEQPQAVFAESKEPKEPKETFAEISNDFSQNSPMLDRHLIEQQAFDQNNDPLLNAQDTVTIVITPRNQYAGLSGKEVLNIVRNYGLKYGVMNMYHRYEREDGMGDLWFSMLGVSYQGVQAFDLNTLADSHFSGLSLFLSLPHPHALRGFESMVSTARMIAKDLDADIHDEEGYVLDDAYVEKMRLQVADYTTS